MKNRRYRNQPKLVGKINGFEMKDVGSNGLAEIDFRADGNRVKLSCWENEDGSTEEYLNNISENETVEALYSNLSQREFDNNIYIQSQLNSPKLIQSTNEDERAMALLEGDVYRFDLSNLTYNEDGKPSGSLKLLTFDLSSYNSDTGKNEYITPAEVLINEIQYRKKKLKQDFPDKSLEPYNNAIESLKADDSVDNVHQTYTELVENDQYMNFYNIYLFDLEFEGDVGEHIVNEINEKDNIKVGVKIINQKSIDEFGAIEGYETKLLIGKFYGVNEKSEVEEDDGNSGW